MITYFTLLFSSGKISAKFKPIMFTNALNHYPHIYKWYLLVRVKVPPSTDPTQSQKEIYPPGLYKVNLE